MKMQMKKYEITEHYLYNYANEKIFQIKALKDFGSIKKGQLGGHIERETNLSHDGDCWVYPNASVSDTAKVMHNAKLMDSSSLIENARAYNNTILLDNASLEGDASIAGKVVMKGNSRMEGHASAEGDDLITKSPIYLVLEGIRVTITENYVLIDYPEDSKHYTKKQWSTLKNKKISKICGHEWRKKWKHILESMVHAS